ncbi:ribbon-helix-helix protein, CopG family [Sinorhizobium meliloti]|uniref:ribbon-helix-helix protein, CopG family n=1 Tax=Rhizobium meliloti TaxID=382 RepID=UPI0012FD01E7|nr:ribbon-helix-helix protein, CopG family [Sinorhizobium meliloti]
MSSQPLFIDHVKIRLEPDLRRALKARARAEHTTMSEMQRRVARELVAPPSGSEKEGRS